MNVCKACGSSARTWSAAIYNPSGKEQGQLSTRDVTCLFALGCDHCSESLGTLAADAVAAQMTAEDAAHPADAIAPGVDRLWRALAPLFDMKLPADYTRLLGNALAAMCRARSAAALLGDRAYAEGLIDALVASDAIKSPHNEKLRSLVNTVANEAAATTYDDIKQGIAP